MTETAICPQCNAILPANAPAGICPRCLMAAGLASDSQSHAPTIDSPSANHFQPPEAAELADKFPQLEVIELLGYGGMGAVYKARQPRLDRFVALKILRPGTTNNAAFAERFSREAKTLARLSHSKIVAVYDFGEVELPTNSGESVQPLYYFVMEYVEGTNLRQLMQTGELSATQAIAIVPEICEALQYAHDRGVVHRDIKPENILVDLQGHVKIADFGLAKLANRSEEDYTLTHAQQVMGTVRYMAPEQMEASGNVDHRADIYSLGVVFYEMLTGEVPAGNFDPPSRKVQVDVRLDEVVLRSLAREPDRRYQHASDIKTDVDRVCTQQAGTSPTADLSQPNSLAAQFEEQQRSAELAEIAPTWHAAVVSAIFFVGWGFVGMMWNFRWPGIVLATIVMTAIAWCVVQFKLRYLPMLRSELQRDPRWARYGNFIPGIVLVGIGVLATIALQPALADSNFILKGFTQDNDPFYYIGDPGRKADLVTRLVKHVGLADVDLIPSEFGKHRVNVLAIASGIVSVGFIFCGVMAMMGTRRYRYSWRYCLVPAFSVTAYCLAMLLFVHAIHALIVGFGTTSVASREIHCHASSGETTARMWAWANDNGYLGDEYVRYYLRTKNEQVGSLVGQRFVPASWFDAYRASWPFVLQRPLPRLSLMIVTNDEDGSVFVQVDLPMAMQHSPEPQRWAKLVDRLEIALTAESTAPEP